MPIFEVFCETIKEVETFKRQRLSEIFHSLNEKQKNEFCQIYGDPEKIHDRCLISAIDFAKRILMD